MAQYTPMMEQYLKVKAQYPDTILFYRLGDFYEMFFDDAKTASRELELVLTGRDCGQPERAPMCGVPFHSADGYIAKLVAKGYKVAVCEQMEDPLKAKGLVARDVIRVHTPGTAIEAGMLDEGKNNFLGCVSCEKKHAGLCFTDVSTGETFATTVSGRRLEDRLIDELARFTPSELLIAGDVTKLRRLNEFLTRKLSVFSRTLTAQETATDVCEREIRAVLPDEKAAPVLAEPALTVAVGAAFGYLRQMQKCDLANISRVQLYGNESYMSVGAAARDDLELVESRRREKKGSLLWVIDRTVTPMGKRMLRAWTEQPLLDVTSILYRQRAVSELFDDSGLCDDLREGLRGIYDVERIMTRIVYGTANAKELRAFAQSVERFAPLKALLEGVKTAMLRDSAAQIDTLEDTLALIDAAITDDPPFSVREGRMIRDGFNAELDELRTISGGGREMLRDIEQREQERTGIKKLKIGYNKVFGYYIEVTNSYKELVPDDYIRKQTLVNCERYITPELKELESKVLGAQERAVTLEYEIFTQIRAKVADAQARLRATAEAVAQLDALSSLAETARDGGYVCPEIDASDVIDIKAGRHPVVEKFMTDAPFVPNDVYLDCRDSRTAIVTGPNMAGKSTYMRQTALIVILAQMGAFVPAAKARIGVCDAVYTRIGASDDLAAGQSTFMTEMVEVAEILSCATKKSLIILDEIGRGTSTYDGMSIARAVLEHVTEKIGAKTLFATHYHELTAMEGQIPGVHNFNTSVKKRGDDITFLRRIVPGPADGSYGVEVAILAGLPAAVTKRARAILEDLTDGEAPAAPVAAPRQEAQAQLSFESDLASRVADEIRMLDTDTLTPIEALTRLYAWKQQLR